ncbi:MAG TPA: DUF763 domain-containing protein [Candidatus Paceibacterota bacterium]|nr:DUF763 domain-containing protein [Candidatus Paceibacterota bacterium]
MPVNRGIATMTLDTGKCPRWLFDRMVTLGGQMTDILVAELGPDEFIRRMGDPVWFQTLGTVLAFDWNASGLTTILTAAIKEAIRDREHELGVFVAGGKGKTSRKTPEQILTWGERIGLPESHANGLVHNSKMSAKVDSALVQDGYQLYHHAFFFSRSGAWAVVQQGMNTVAGRARRYHWSSDSAKDLIVEPHSGIAAQEIHPRTLNMTARKSDKGRQTSLELVGAGYAPLMKDVRLIREYSSELAQVWGVAKGQQKMIFADFAGREFKTHPVLREDFAKSKYLEKILSRLTDLKPGSYEQMVATPGVGPKTVRALALVAEVIYGAKSSYEDPARYAFAHGGKDATPYPVDTATYDRTIGLMAKAVRSSRMATSDKSKAIDRLFSSRTGS